MSARKAERLLNLIVMLLETTRPVTPEEIHRTIPGYGQDNWETFKRMFERDKEELREMGIPVEMAPTDVWETEEGYRIPKDRYYLPDLNLEQDEIAALWLAAGLVRLHDRGAARSAVMKLAGDESPRGADNPEWLSADLGLAVPNLPRVFEAVIGRKKIHFDYVSKSGATDRTLHPYGLIHRKGAWYMVGHDERSEEIRPFRLDRIHGTVSFIDPSHSDPEFDVPDGFRPNQVLDVPPFAQGVAIAQVKVRFEPSVAWWVERASPWLRLDLQTDTSATCAIDVTDVTGFISWLLGFGDGAELIEPPEMRAKVRERLETIIG